jgi:class 3 adenylate cyclase
MTEATVEPETAAVSKPAAHVPKRAFTKEYVNHLLDNKWVNILLTAATIYALFGEDLRSAAAEASQDKIFQGFTIVIFIVFTVEIGLTCYSKPDYVFKFYFWLDLVSTISLIADMGVVLDGSESASDTLTSSSANGGNPAAATLRVGRATRVGTKASRIVRIVRLVRLVRIVKLYKHAKGKDEVEDLQEGKPSQIGKKMTEVTTKRLIVLVLLLLLALPVFQCPDQNQCPDITVDNYRQYSIDNLHRYAQDHNISVTMFQNKIMDLVRPPYSDNLVYLEVCDPTETGQARQNNLLPGCKTSWKQSTLYDWLKGVSFPTSAGVGKTTNTNYNGWTYQNLIPNANDLTSRYRITDIAFVCSGGCWEGGQLVFDDKKLCATCAGFSIQSANAYLAWLNFGKTWFIMAVLVIGSLMFTKDSSELVIEPIERMMNMIEQLATNPLKKTTMTPDNNTHPTGAGAESFETTILEQTLAKISQLLQIGFGQAGDAIIGKNMGGDGALDPMIPGKKIFAIFGFCDVRYFLPLTECLQEEIMVFVNMVALIVHSSVHLYKGCANKNIGDCWLLVWKLPKETSEESISPANHQNKDKAIKDFNMNEAEPTNSGYDEFNPSARSPLSKESLNLQNDSRIMCIADSALASFIKIIVDYKLARLDSSNPLYVFEHYPDLVKLNWHLSMGFGLQIGWAIEGAIGSTYKIDASYLSPHVNMASRLEAATKQYHVDILISHYLHCLLSPAAKKLCRKVDRVTVKGSALPMELFTYDIVNITKSIGYQHADPDPVVDAARCIDFETDEEFLGLQKGIHPNFKPLYEAGIDAYLSGDWGLARTKFEAAKALKDDDGPIQTLMEVLEESHFVAPESWKGFRPLTSK